MLENEFGGAGGATGDQSGNDQDDKKTTRPRRASRPAGPPPEPPEADTAARPVTRPAGAVTEGAGAPATDIGAAPAEDTASRDRAPEEEPAKPTRSRRGGTRREAPARVESAPQ